MLDKPTKVFMVVPTAGHMHENCHAVVTQVLLNEQSITQHAVGRGRPIDYLRNQFVRTLLAAPQYSHIFFVDSDTEMPIDALDRLLALDVPIASGCYAVHMRDGFRWALGNLDADGRYRLLARRPSFTEPFQVDAGGAGCLLVRREIFEQTTYPWFNWVNNPDGSQISEDMWFFGQCHKHGHRVTVDPLVVCKHYKEVDITSLLLLVEQRAVMQPQG